MKKNPISTRRIFPSSQVPPSSVISYGVFLLVFIILISFMLFRTSSQQENLINMNSRLIDLEQQVQQSVQSSEVTVETLSDDLKEVNREIRKLWDLSNKRNKQRIATLEDQLNSIDSSIKEIFTQSQEIRLISKEFSNFGTTKKNLVFEYKIDFIVLPAISNNLKRISLGYTPNLSSSSSITIEAGELWSNSSNESTDFRQVIVPLPLISNFNLSFTL